MSLAKFRKVSKGAKKNLTKDLSTPKKDNTKDKENKK
jgi:hypothetical protein